MYFWDVLEVVLVEVVKCAYLWFYLWLLTVGCLTLLETISHAHVLMKKESKDEPIDALLSTFASLRNQSLVAMGNLHLWALWHLGHLFCFHGWSFWCDCGGNDYVFDSCLLQCLGIPRQRQNLQWYLLLTMWLDLNYMRWQYIWQGTCVCAGGFTHDSTCVFWQWVYMRWDWS